MIVHQTDIFIYIYILYFVCLFVWLVGCSFVPSLFLYVIIYHDIFFGIAPNT